MAVNHGLLIHDSIAIDSNVNGRMHNSRDKGWKKIIYSRKQRSWDVNRADKPIVHNSVLLRKKNVGNNDNPPYKPWILELAYELAQ